MSKLDEKFSCLEIKSLPYVFRISVYEGRYYIYYFDNQKRADLDFQTYSIIKEKMMLIAGLSEVHDYDYYFKELQKLLDVWKFFFPAELKDANTRNS